MKDLLRLAQFRRLVGAWTIGNFADSALFLTLAVWAKDLTGSSGAAGLVFFCLGVPMLISPLFGLLADRMRRRPLLIASNLLAAGAVLGLLAVRAPSDVWLLYAVTVVYGGLGSLNGAAQSGLLRTMLSDEHLGPANAMFMTIDQGLRILTPLVGAGLYAVYGGPTLAVATAIMLTVTAGGLALVRVVEPKPDRGSATARSDAGWRALAAGFAHLRRTPQLLSIVIGLGAALSVIGLFDSLLFAVVEHGLHRSPEFFGVLMSAQGAGSILGGLTAVRLMKACGPVRAVGVALLTMAAGSIPFLAGNVALVLVGMVAAGAAIPWAFVSMATTRQKLTPNHLQGRTASATGVSLQVPQLVSTGVGAAIVALVDYRLLTVIATVIIAMAGLWLVQRARRSVPPEAEVREVSAVDATGDAAAGPAVRPAVGPASNPASDVVVDAAGAEPTPGEPVAS
jgi:MFS family permease